MRTKWGHGKVLRAPWMRTYKQATKPPWGKIFGITRKVIFLLFLWFLFIFYFIQILEFYL